MISSSSTISIIPGETQDSYAKLKEALDECVKQEGWAPGHERRLHEMMELFKAIKIHRSERPLVILDLNGVLVDRQYGKDLVPQENTSWKVGNFLMYKRPNLHFFLGWVFSNFDVAVWSSVKAFNILQMIDFIFPESKDTIKFIWSQDECEQEEHPDPELREKKPLFIKDLRKVWAEHPQYDLNNTIIVDDTPEKIRPDFARHIKAETWTHDTANDEYLYGGGPLEEALTNFLKQQQQDTK